MFLESFLEADFVKAHGEKVSHNIYFYDDEYWEIRGKHAYKMVDMDD